MYKIASVFIVEDDLSVLKLYSMILEFNGFEIIGTAKNGLDALEKYKEFSKKPDVIIMDHRMPIKNGIETSKEILQIDNTAKIIIISADNSIKEICQSIGVAGFISKPFNNKKLINKINKVL